MSGDPPPLGLRVDASIAEALQRREGEWVTVGGSVSAVRMSTTSRGARVARITLTDFHGSIDVLVLGAWVPERDEVVLAGGRIAHAARGIMLVAQVLERYDWQGT